MIIPVSSVGDNVQVLWPVVAAGVGLSFGAAMGKRKEISAWLSAQLAKKSAIKCENNLGG
jgi:hypothetical protein